MVFSLYVILLSLKLLHYDCSRSTHMLSPFRRELTESSNHHSLPFENHVNNNHCERGTINSAEALGPDRCGRRVPSRCRSVGRNRESGCSRSIESARRGLGQSDLLQIDERLA